MKHMFLLMLLLAGVCTVAASAQDRPKQFLAVHQIDVAAGYTAIYANAPPPGGCSCFWMNGGSAEIAFADAKKIGLVFNFGMTTASDIGTHSGHDLTLATYVVGPRYTFTEGHRLSPYAHALLGAAHSSTNNALDDGKTSFAFNAGGGLDMKLTHRFSWRVVQADYLLTQIPNGLNNKQDQLRLTSGVVFHLR